ncbi:cytochrome c biogenesis protein CcsA [Robbsia sp. KACC 23696]|uniref:cytochrome C assembly family protein n=1 Tax=Robbsia sp. KACC 23696 TaxID=3149231 RepID=UPI00325B2821
MIIVLYAVTALLYGGLSIAAWRAFRQQPGLRTDLESAGGFVTPLMQGAGASGTSAAAARNGMMPLPGRLALLVALLAHGTLLHMTIFPANGMYFGFALSLSSMLWLGAGIYMIESWFFPLEGLGVLVLPLAALASLLPLPFTGVRVLDYAADPLFKVHFLIANVAYGLLTIAALHAVLMLFVERRLHAARRSRATGAAVGAAYPRTRSAPGGDATPEPVSASASWFRSWVDALPPLLTMEKLLFRMISAGFALLTLTLLSGALFSEQLLDRAFSLDHKTVFAVLSWLMFGGLVAGRHFYGWRGRTALRWVLASFVALLLAYVGSRFVLEVLLHRQVV